MSTHEILTRGTIWLSIVAYAVGVATFAFSRKQRRLTQVTRLLWSAAVISLLAHVAFAFHFYHSWSHAHAFQDTARQTQEKVGWNWGGGLYVNYVLLVGWIADLGWWWLRGLGSYYNRPSWLIALWHGFLIFVIFNGTVVFEEGWVRWAGVFVCFCLCLLWWRGIKTNWDASHGWSSVR